MVSHGVTTGGTMQYVLVEGNDNEVTQGLSLSTVFFDSVLRLMRAHLGTYLNNSNDSNSNDAVLLTLRYVALENVTEVKFFGITLGDILRGDMHLDAPRVLIDPFRGLGCSVLMSNIPGFSTHTVFEATLYEHVVKLLANQVIHGHHNAHREETPTVLRLVLSFPLFAC